MCVISRGKKESVWVDVKIKDVEAAAEGAS
jgi:hypothetical protein